jgi:RNA polymerase sigma factor (sigma-70 family)
MTSLIGEISSEYELFDTNQLLQKVIREKDKNAWGALAVKEERKLLNYARYRFQSVSEADLEDLVQTVFVKIFEKDIHYKGTSPGEAHNYLKRMLHNQVVTFCQRMKWTVRVENWEDDDQEYENLVERDAGRPDTLANCRADQIQEDDKCDASFFLSNGKKPHSLTLQERRVVKLICEGNSHKEIARSEGCSEARITAITQSIREKFSRYLAQGEPSEPQT